MGSNAAFEEPTPTKIHQTQYEEGEEEQDKVGDLERKTSSFLREKMVDSTDSSTLTITTSGSSSSSSSSSSDGTDSLCTFEPNGKELGVDQINASEAENSMAPESPEQDKDPGFQGDHNDEMNGSVYLDEEQVGAVSNGAASVEPVAPESRNVENLNGERNQPDAENGSIAKDNEQSLEIEEVGMRDSPEDPMVVRQLDADVIEEEVDIEADDYGVEKVLENQETHDLYCPNCNSCITKRVVLKRRKRKIPHVVGDAKREKLNIPEDPVHSVDNVRSVDNAPHAEDSVDGPCLFRCLSCFSIFLPTGEGFKLFRSNKGVKENETPLLSKETPTNKANWFLSLFGPNKKETAVEEGGTRTTAPQVHPQDGLVPSPETTTGSTSKDPTEAKDGGQGSVTTLNPGVAATSTSQVNSPLSDINGAPAASDQLETEVPVRHVVSTLPQDHKPVATESHDSSKPVIDEGETTVEGLGFLASLAGKDDNLSNGNKTPDKVCLSPIRHFDNIESSEKVPVGHVEGNLDPKLPVVGGLEPKDSSTTKLDSAPINGTGDNLEIVSDPGRIEVNPAESPLDSLTTGFLAVRDGTQPRMEVGEGRKLDILKSIVYGGLIESITSLGVISSAAGSGATTLNILVLGLANLIGGIILIVHNLQELREENPRITATDGDQSNEQEDRYKRLLGRRENFRLHATVAILSFIIVGLIPPVVYGFSFQKSDNKDYKAISVLGASLICVILLAIAKAHVKTPRDSYLKSMLYYTTMAISASGVSYFVGHIVSQWIEKQRWFDGSENPVQLMLPLLGRKGGFGYSSY